MRVMAYNHLGAAIDRQMRQSALSGLGDVEMFLGNPTAAQARYQEAIELDPDEAPGLYALYQLGRVVLQQGDHAAAVDIFNEIITRSDTALADDAKLALALTRFLARKEDAAREAHQVQRVTERVAEGLDLGGVLHAGRIADGCPPVQDLWTNCTSMRTKWHGSSRPSRRSCLQRE